ncbi:signal peptidase I [Thermotalea metallivorans]|uniref:Signal peptidase I n=1 Tax=Thermotalea metallivorans TaxID=520762 RepID=A0A140LEI1_9FIRM|nr:signal peptidase I [Thermotalea metallivorans]KXG78956.1 Signal peptidase IB [Thermotalea metallivorans]
MLDQMVDILKKILAAVLIAILMEEFVFGFTVVQGESMAPTVKNHDKLFVNKISYLFHKPQIGDIVIFHPPIEERKKEFFIKRVIAVENDEFLIQNGKVYINGKAIDEPYVKAEKYEEKDYDICQGRVPKGMVFVMGDNRNDSNDSRSFGFVPIKDIEGKADFRIWPFDTAKAFTVNDAHKD